MTDIRRLADQHRKTDKHNQLAAELGLTETFDFHARRLVRNAALEASDLRSRVNHIFRNRDKMEWTEGAKSDLALIITELECSLNTAREVQAATAAEEQTFLEAAE